MSTLLAVLQVAVALGLLNVWLLRAGRRTGYRGGNAASMAEEFAAYGLPEWFMYLTGALKIAAAVMLIVGLWVPVLVVPAAVLLCGLMLGALSMHAKIGDSIRKSVPALLVLAASLIIAVGTYYGAR